MSDMQTTEQLVSMIRQRALVEFLKLDDFDRADLTEEQWLQHLLEEVCDAGGYILAAQRRALETKTGVLAAISLLEQDDKAGALDVLKSIYPE